MKSPSEFIELSTAQMRKQFEIVSAQNKKLCALGQEMATEAAEKIKTGMSKALNDRMNLKTAKALGRGR